LRARPIDSIPVEVLLRHAVWEYDLDEAGYEPEQDETWVSPVAELPVDDLSNRVVVTKATLASGQTVTATLSNLSLGHARKTKHFLLLSVEKDGQWQHLARYFDAWSDTSGAEQLAGFLGLHLEDVFPISYDISAVARGVPEVVAGKISAEPDEKLIQDELMALLLA